MYLCLTVECIASGLHWSGLQFWSHPPPFLPPTPPPRYTPPLPSPLLEDIVLPGGGGCLYCCCRCFRCIAACAASSDAVTAAVGGYGGDGADGAATGGGGVPRRATPVHTGAGGKHMGWRAWSVPDVHGGGGGAEWRLDSGKDVVCLRRGVALASGSLPHRRGSHPAASGRVPPSPPAARTCLGGQRGWDMCDPPPSLARPPCLTPGRAPRNPRPSPSATTTASDSPRQMKGSHPARRCPRIRRPSHCLNSDGGALLVYGLRPSTRSPDPSL